VLTVTGLGLGAVVLTTVGQTLKPLEPIGLLAIRQPHRGPQGVPVNRTAEQAQVMQTAMDPAWTLQLAGPTPFSVSLAEVEALAQAQAWFPIACVEGWSALAHWRGVRLIDLVRRAGGGPDSQVRVHSLEPFGFNSSEIFGPQLSAALLATHLNGERLNIDHGYPLRLIAPNRAGVLNTKWLAKIEVLP
jgi:DMSO/TMAO reductase YedYZ molybdopterin-dependent catalytic subunit